MWQNDFINKLKAHKWIIAAFLAIIAFRIGYFFLNAPYILYQNDTNSYSDGFTQNIFAGEISDTRTPIYPHFIKLIRFITQTQYMGVVIFQSIIGFLSLLVLWKIIKKYAKSNKVAISCLLAYGLQPTIFHWDKVIVTESLSISASIFFIWTLLNYLEKPKKLKAIWLSFFSFFLIMLRPGFIPVLAVIILFWILRFIMSKPDRLQTACGFVASLVCVGLVFSYIHLNTVQNQVPALSTAQTANQIMSLVAGGIYQNSAYQDVVDCLEGSPYWDDDEKDPNFNLRGWRPFDKKFGFTPAYLNDYVNDTIRIHRGEYIKYTMLKFVKSMKGIVPCVITNSTPDEWVFSDIDEIDLEKVEEIQKAENEKINTVIMQLTSIILMFPGFAFIFFTIYLFVIISFVVNIINWIKGRLDWFEMGLCVLIIAQIATIIIGSAADYNRLAQPILPFVFTMLFKQIAQGKWRFMVPFLRMFFLVFIDITCAIRSIKL